MLSWSADRVGEELQSLPQSSSVQRRRPPRRAGRVQCTAVASFREMEQTIPSLFSLHASSKRLIDCINTEQNNFFSWYMCVRSACQGHKLICQPSASLSRPVKVAIQEKRAWRMCGLRTPHTTEYRPGAPPGFRCSASRAACVASSRSCLMSRTAASTLPSSLDSMRSCSLGGSPGCGSFPFS